MNEFSKCGQALTQTDIEKLESDLGTRLPEAMRDHYLRFNGGMPTLDWFPMTDDWDAIWVHEFLPVGTRAGQEPAIQSIYAQVAGRAGYPRSLIPFAVDPGGNIFSVDTDNGAVHYWLTDTYDETLTDAENRKKADRRLTGSFEQFVSSLVSEDEAFN
ncbi:SMI1/KNR4 family protein [Trinickia sp. LjRoot230]|uniref:SMI1/KNR4 family protein n=1 Tax=Trinickia sp. LjRoot230 TaxID=3342288 RepID=UPI003ED030F5